MQSLTIPPCTRASFKLLYDSLRVTYLPTTAIATDPFGSFTFLTISSHAERLGERVQMFSFSTILLSSPSLLNTTGTSYMDSTSLAVMTASFSMLQYRAIFAFNSGERNLSVRQRRISGWIPISLHSFTEIWVGFGLRSPAGGV